MPVHCLEIERNLENDAVLLLGSRRRDNLATHDKYRILILQVFVVAATMYCNPLSGYTMKIGCCIVIARTPVFFRAAMSPSRESAQQAASTSSSAHADRRKDEEEEEEEREDDSWVSNAQDLREGDTSEFF